MDSNQKIQDLQRQIGQEQENIRKCNHIFGQSFYNAETYREPTYDMVAHGSDVGYEITGSTEKTKDRWTRKCTKCGTEQHAYTKKPVVVGYEPDFK